MKAKIDVLNANIKDLEYRNLLCEADVKKLRNNMDKEILLSNDLLNSKIEL